MRFDISLLSDDLGLGYKWIGGDKAADNNVYCAPSNATKILKIDTKTLQTSLVGPDLGNEEYSKYSAAYAHGRIVFFIPCNAPSRIMKFNIDTEEVEYVRN